MKKPTLLPSKKPREQRIALVLQGGGALGAYQAGIYQALDEHDLTPDWVVGTSIGAINAALIAGNHRHNRLTRLREFWDRVAHQDAFDLARVPDEARRLNTMLATMDSMTRGVPGFFSPRPFSLFPMGLAVEPEFASFYDTSPLAASLAELIDFDYLNLHERMRLTVNALKVTSGELVSFDSARQRIGVEHIMASGALPPGFPPVRIDGELYWDGGLYSNTPLDTVLDDEPRTDTLCFMVDLWSADGPEPTTLDQVQTRQKDVMFASRSQQHINEYLKLHNLRLALHAMHAKIPAELQTKADIKHLATLGCDSIMHIVRLPYAGRDWHMASKDINFSKGSIAWRWEQGYNDAMRAIGSRGWLNQVPEGVGVVVHEVPPHGGAPMRKVVAS
ncbi:NTE family protein [Actimicrobium sp. GrIS 1.19]|uniref:patatin-like phospholipase family protein n=1 Tax=Actimicrobium sp. GrIS 1.19 TaxID=3071708 RepID=UPI002DF9F668|nr:NTE family protein [Actimicrobium sp. GrIS 1.19]